MTAWTERDAILPEDKPVIEELTRLSPEGARILVTGEARKDYIGEDGALVLSLANNTLPEPLFVETREGTIRMIRFRPEEVWRCFNPDILVRLAGEESGRLGREFIPLDEFDFYRSFIQDIRRNFRDKSNVPIPEDKNGEAEFQASYLGALLLFDKPLFGDVRVESFFCRKEAEAFLASARFRPLNPFEENQYQKAREAGKDKTRLTNQELGFLRQMYGNDTRGRA
jgi:hypothetical protein